MNRLNRLFVATSISVLLVTVERFSFTTHVLLQPDDFLRLHELIQMTVLILITVVVPALILREVSANFTALSTATGRSLLLAFIVGTYFYATGNGVHELASFTLNTYCDANKPTGDLCGGLFVNDFYTGNILFFVGAFLVTASLISMERMNPGRPFSRSGTVILVANSVVYALTIVAYAGFDTVLVGLAYSLSMTVFATAFLLSARRRYREFPFTLYTTIAYLLGSIASIVARLS